VKRNGPSIRRRLLVLLTVLLSGVWGLAAYFTYRAARHEVTEVYDANLVQNARVVVALLRHEAAEARDIQEKVRQLQSELNDDLRRFPVLANMLEEHLKNGEAALSDHFTADSQPGHPYESRIAVLGRQSNDTILLRSPNAPDFGSAEPGFSDFGPVDDRWRVFTVTEPESGLTIQVGERRELRNEMVRHVTFSTMAPLFLALPLLALLAWFAVGRGLRPLVKLARSVEQRRPDTLDPLDNAKVPREAKPLADSLNRLFGRMHETLENERRFTADAAHELRTPLAALKTQAQVAQRSVDPVQRAHALSQIVAGADRTTHLVEQLLALARSDAGQRADASFTRIDLATVARDVLRELAPGAGAKRIELELTGETVTVFGSREALHMLLRNLVDNSIRYSDAGAQVTVNTRRQGAQGLLRVTDTGPGIPPDQRQSVFKRFHRGSEAGDTGSGLGLSIVQRIADLHKARLELEDGPDGRGLSVAVLFPG
jgi:two-component system sensor histidine kinase QseC